MLSLLSSTHLLLFSPEAYISLRPTKDDSQPRKPQLNEANRAQPEPPPGKRSLEPAGRQPTRSVLGIGSLDINTTRSGEDVSMRDISEEGAEDSLPRKRAATGDGISAGSWSPFRDSSPPSYPRRSIARPTSGQFEGRDGDNFRRNIFDTPSQPPTSKRQLWQEGSALSGSSLSDPSNIASIAARKARAQTKPPDDSKPRNNRNPFQPPPPCFQPPRSQSIPSISSYPPVSPTAKSSNSILEDYEIILQPETRPISQEQLVAEVKGIYAGLVMVEARCIEVDNKQATLAQPGPEAQPKLNNEQWQALIALHRTLLHEHHDFFLASQHSSASAALRRLASKYATPARMGRHGIHSFLELLRHRLPASLDHMLAFIYLAYSMMTLLYETVPAIEDTWIECLGDLGRYRMAIEDDDIRDREVWTGVARHWYSKASDKAPTTGRLYHHLAILARPNALQQLFYYAKSLCVVTPFTSARESILTLFDPVLNADNHQGLYRLPPLDTSFVKAHGLLFTNKNVEKLELTVKEFLSLLGNQIGRVTRKFMEQGYHIAAANCVAMLGFASKSKRLSSILSGLWHYRSAVGFSTFYAQIGTVMASDSATTENDPQSVLRRLLESQATQIALTLGAGVGGAIIVRRRWKLDMTPISNFIYHFGIWVFAEDSWVSTETLLVLCLYGVATNSNWMKNNLIQYPRTGAMTAVGIGALGIYSGWTAADQFPGLEARFVNQSIPKAIIALPMMAGYSMIWWAVIEQTGLARAIEARLDSPQLWGFIIGILRASFIHCFARAIQVFMERFFGRVDAGFQNLFQGPAEDVEADPRAYFPRNEPFRGPENVRFYRQETEDGFFDRGESPLHQY